MSKTHKPGESMNRNHKGNFRHSGDDSSRHQPEKASHHDRMSKSSSDKARGEST